MILQQSSVPFICTTGSGKTHFSNFAVPTSISSKHNFRVTGLPLCYVPETYTLLQVVFTYRNGNSMPGSHGTFCQFTESRQGEYFENDFPVFVLKTLEAYYLSLQREVPLHCIRKSIPEGLSVSTKTFYKINNTVHQT